MIRMATVIMLLLCVTAAHANFSSNALKEIAAEPTPDAQLPLDIQFLDEHGQPRTLLHVLGGRPAVLVFADYTCRTLCGPILAFAAAALDKTGLRPGGDYHLVVIGIDPKDPAGSAITFKDSRVGHDSPLAAATIMLTGQQPAINALMQAAGYRYAYDTEHDQFAHPAAAYVLTAEGRIARLLPGLAMNAPDLRLALVEAADGKIGNVFDRIHLLCYGFDPARGIYTASIMRWLDIGGGLTAAALAASIGLLLLRKRRAAAS
jgi:protein SCO1